MPSVFPTQGAYGYTAEHGYREKLTIYNDGMYRRNLRSTFNHRQLVLEFQGIKQADKEAIETFFKARKSSTVDDQFYVYNPEETTVVDLSGASTTGRHTAIFLDDTLEFTRNGKCRWSGSTRIFLLN